MRRPLFWGGVTLGALAYPFGLLVGTLLFRRSVLYPK